MAGAPAANAAALIIAGGRSTRFWPEGRASRPKPLFAPDGKTTLLDAAVARAIALCGRERSFIVVVRDHAAIFRRALGNSLPRENLLVEPQARGTAVAIAYGAAVIAARLGAELTLAVTPCDHFIPQPAAFQRTLLRAMRLARQTHAMVLLGIPPTRAETGYGYQRVGGPAGLGYRVADFVEKPSLERARKMVRSGRYLWNGGIFVMEARTLADEMKRHTPALAVTAARMPRMSAAALAALYRNLDFPSFDRAIVEPSKHLMGIRADFAWDDVGSWEGLWQALRGASENVEIGDVVTLDSRGVLARSGKRLMVLLGVDDLIAVDTEDALLIARRSKSQDLIRVLDELKRRKLDRYL